jgi:uncharacterized repeat protein (TIGR03803 family)
MMPPAVSLPSISLPELPRSFSTPRQIPRINGLRERSRRNVRENLLEREPLPRLFPFMRHHQLGTIPSYTTWECTLREIHKFTWAKYPLGNLIRDAAGNLYGTTFGGTPNGHGAVWKLNPNPDGSWAANILHVFEGADGSAPAGGLVFDAAGNLYGTTLQGGDETRFGGPGCGVVFKLAPEPDGSWRESVLHIFTGGDGAFPDAGLIFDAAGNLYGTTASGGAKASGTVFKLAPNPDGTGTESVLHSFTGEDGNNPRAGLIFDGAGNLYSTTSSGGAYNQGTVFKLAPNPDGTWTESVLHNFTGGADGSAPAAGLTFDPAGNLYGAAAGGGSPNTACSGGCGVVFKLTPTLNGWRETVLHTFMGHGKFPKSSVIFDPAGNLYGTTSDGNNTCDYGFVFEITP